MISFSMIPVYMCVATTCCWRLFSTGISRTQQTHRYRERYLDEHGIGEAFFHFTFEGPQFVWVHLDGEFSKHPLDLLLARARRYPQEVVERGPLVPEHFAVDVQGILTPRSSLDP